MPQALITVNSVVGSNDDLPINTLVTLANDNVGGETTYLWEIVDQPVGTADTLSSTSAPSVTFTPKKEGSYLVKLTVNGTLENKVIVGIRQLKTRIRVPAASETSEVNSTKGWALAANVVLQLSEAARTDPGVFVGVADGSLSVGQVVRVVSTTTIKATLPGQEVLSRWGAANATTAANCRGLLGVVVQSVDGGAITAGVLFQVRTVGLAQGLSVSGSPAVGALVYLDDAGTLSGTQGTVRRIVGHVASGGGPYAVWWDGAFPDFDGAFVPLTRTLTGTEPIAVAGVHTAVDLSANRTLSFQFSGQADGDIVRRAAGAWARLAIGSSGHVLTVVGGLPAWAAPAASSVTINTASPLQGGGTGASFNLSFSVASEAHGDLLYRNGSAWVRLAPGTAGYLLQTNGAGSAPTWVAPPASSITINTSAPLTGGGTGSSFTLGVTFGTTAGTILEGSNDALYVKLAGTQTITGVKTFNADIQLSTTRKLLGVAELRLESTGAQPIQFVTNSVERGRFVQGFMVGTTTDPGAGSARIETSLGLGTTPVASAMLEMNSTTKGLLVPRMTTTQRNAIAAADWLLIFNTTIERYEYFNGFVWLPVGYKGIIPEYIVGTAGYGPFGASPQFDTWAGAKAAAQAAGHVNADYPAHFKILPGTYNETIDLEPGWFVSGMPGAEKETIVSKITATFTTDGSYGPTDVDYCGAAFLTVRNAGVSGSAIHVAPVGDKAAAVMLVHRVDASNTAGSTDAVIHVESGAVAAGLLGDIIGARTSTASADAVIRNVGGQVSLAVDSMDAPNSGTAQPPIMWSTAGGVTYISPGNPSIYVSNGQYKIEGGSELVLFPGVNAITASLTGENSLFMLAGSSVVKLLGNHVFSSGANTTYLFNTSDATGSVQIGGAYNLIGATASIPYRTAAGITVNGYTSVHDEVLEVITGTATIAASTTLAIIIPPSATTFTVTLPDPTGWTHGRPLTVKYTGPTYKTPLTLARPSGKQIDYKSSNITLEWNDSYVFFPYSNGWLIRAGYSENWGGGGGGGLPDYTFIPLSKTLGYTTNAPITIGGGVFKSAEHDLTGGRKAYFRAIIRTTDITEMAKVQLYTNGGAVELQAAQDYLDTASTAWVVLESADLNALAGANWPPADGDIFDVVLDSGHISDGSAKYSISAELVFEP